MLRVKTYTGAAKLFVASVALTRSIAYIPLTPFKPDNAGPLILTDEGEYMWLYGTLWLICGLLLLWDTFGKDTGWGVPLFSGLMVVWGLSYLAAWLISDFHSLSWMSFALYAGMGGAFISSWLANARLRSMLEVGATRDRLVATGVIPAQLPAEVHATIELKEGGN